MANILIAFSGYYFVGYLILCIFSKLIDDKWNVFHAADDFINLAALSTAVLIWPIVLVFTFTVRSNRREMKKSFKKVWKWLTFKTP